MLGYTTVSGFAGVYSELIMKNRRETLWAQGKPGFSLPLSSNPFAGVKMYLWGVIANAAGIMWTTPSDSLGFGHAAFRSLALWVVIASQVCT